MFLTLLEKKKCKKFMKRYEKAGDILICLYITGKDSQMSNGGILGKGYLKGIRDCANLLRTPLLKRLECAKEIPR
jgi:hypothetical protein